jgi:23S rRNA pseudouridine2604 synthase
LTTLKITKPPQQAVAANRAPIRRGDPAKRVRTSAPAAKAKPEVAQTDSLPPSRREPTVHRKESATPQTRQSQQKPDSSARRERQNTNRDMPRSDRLRDHTKLAEPRQARTANQKTSAKPAPGNAELPRLSKRMAELGLCSRREADEWIANGWVSVDGVVIDTLGTRISPDAQITVSAAARQHQSETVTIIMNKPVGYVSGQAEDGYQPAIVLINPENQWREDGRPLSPGEPRFKRGHLQGLAPAGRLDIDSTGLLVFTQDGRVAKQLIGENSTVEKEYLVRVEGTLSEQGLKLLNHGLSLDGVKLKPAKVSWQNEDQLRFVLREGRKRQIRRMCELVGLTVVGLKRVRIGSVLLGRLPLGTWRYLRLGERF